MSGPLQSVGLVEIYVLQIIHGYSNSGISGKLLWTHSVTCAQCSLLLAITRRIIAIGAALLTKTIRINTIYLISSKHHMSVLLLLFAFCYHVNIY